MAYEEVCSTVMTNLFLQNRLLAIAVAICTKLMRWFGRLHALFQRVGERANIPDWINEQNPGSLVWGFLLWLLAFGLYALIPLALGARLRGCF